MGSLRLSALAQIAPTGPQPITRSVFTEADIGKPLAPRPTDMTARQAIPKARAFLAAAGLPAPKHPPTYSLYCNGLLQRTCEVMFGIIQDQEYSVNIDSQSGQVKEFRNWHLQNQQLRHAAERSKLRPVLTTRQQAKETVWRLARKIGLPANAFLLPLHWHEADDPEHTDANHAGAIIADFKTPFPGGYPGRTGEPGMKLVLDPLTGELAEFSQEWRYQVVTTQARLTANQAIAAATSIVTEYVTKHPDGNGFASNGRPLPVSGASLAYATPVMERIVHGEKLKSSDRWHFPIQMRLTWIVKYGPSEIWIDAVEGSQLGAQDVFYK